MRIDVLTLFPAAFHGPLDVSIIGRARAEGLLDLRLHDVREHAADRHRTVDDYPFGGGQGMVIRVDVLDRALDAVQTSGDAPGQVVYLTPQGERLTDAIVRELAREPRLVLVCGRYEGVDQRFVDHRVDREISIGDYILTGGELPAMVLIDAVARHVPGALGDETSPEDESFVAGLLEYPHYTRPSEYRGWPVPEVLLGGHHERIRRWRAEQRVERTRLRRPDLLTPDNAVLPPVKRPRRVKGFAVRLARSGDVPSVLTLWADSAPGSRLDDADEAVTLAATLEDEPGLFLVAELRRRVIGAVLGAFDGRRGYLRRLAVVPECRGSGVAGALLEGLTTHLATLGCRRLSADVADGNFAAMRFLEGRGWQRRAVRLYEQDLPRAVNGPLLGPAR